MNFPHHQLLNQVEIGRSKTVGLVLPGDNHVYGYKPTPDPEGVKESLLKSFA